MDNSTTTLACYAVTTIHDGTDYAVVQATPDDITHGCAMMHAEAVALCRTAVAEARRAGHRCAWFDLSAGGGAL